MKLPNRPNHHKLAFTLAAHFPEYRKNQLELLVLMVFALIQAQTVRHAKLAERFLILTMHLTGRIASPKQPSLNRSSDASNGSSTASRSAKPTSCHWFLLVYLPNRNRPSFWTAQTGDLDKRTLTSSCSACSTRQPPFRCFGNSYRTVVARIKPTELTCSRIYSAFCLLNESSACWLIGNLLVNPGLSF